MTEFDRHENIKEPVNNKLIPVSWFEIRGDNTLPRGLGSRPNEERLDIRFYKGDLRPSERNPLGSLAIYFAQRDSGEIRAA